MALTNYNTAAPESERLAAKPASAYSDATAPPLSSLDSNSAAAANASPALSHSPAARYSIAAASHARLADENLMELRYVAGAAAVARALRASSSALTTRGSCVRAEAFVVGASCAIFLPRRYMQPIIEY